MSTDTGTHVRSALPGADADPGDPRRPWCAGALLAGFAAAGVLTSADVRVAERLGELTGEDDPTVHLAAALAVRAVRAGSVCVDLADAPTLAAEGSGDEPDAPPPDVALPWPDLVEWTAAVRRSPMLADGVDGPADRPVRWVDGRVYLDRYWRDEQVVRRDVDARLVGLLDVDDAALRAAVHARFGGPQDSRQRLAAATAALSRLTVLTGGPGTGKTTTVARLVAVLRDVAGPGLRVALAAPTGKAAARLQEAVNAELARLAGETADAAAPLTASTVHRLLGWRPSSTRFAHDRTHRLPHDVVVLDEASMVSLPLLARVLDALRPDARLVLVGDPDQLASVEVGAVLGDLVARPPARRMLPARLAAVLPGDVPGGSPADVRDAAALHGGVVRLVVPHRFGHDLGALADAVRRGDGDSTLALLRAGGPHASLVEPAGVTPADDEVPGLRLDVGSTGALVTAAARAGDAAGALEALNAHRLLLAHRRGPAGVRRWAALAERWVAEATGDHEHGPWPVGRPLLVTANDRTTGLSNGDTGVIVSDGAGGVVAAFGEPRAVRLVRPHRLPAVEPVHAMTVHRAQGSQFTGVTVLLPPASSPLLTRELLYTAVTRAREHVRVVGSADAVRAAVERPVRRASGLRFAR
ncbi:exodeoxyribonuclease V subunit alpha [Cellulomonas xiejunii]|uniref:RecBCD enzyme subunit RecD n=1 Tax=Cellulomonas xiejunii TaxID=2968083 RepID=A0ABY5KLE1_9CELL|nr:exodeoxyribonuclease V subunit alpha [Cellulomonas xiejunii]MCC2320280.1 exodeoxyribonuclease V subunit alpha [Cellulomonas xiejunii]UUI70584.1 exodeoxyribonuclease V subunit alpha [Cellulomonas xiejunii]